jgi:antitoxin component YwqK of YwqJK toxin-antitoxin module
LEKETEYFADGSLDEERFYEYSDNGKIDTISYANVDGLKVKELFRYDNMGNLTEVTTYSADNKTTKRLLVKYDAAGNVVKLTTYDVVKKFGTINNEMVDMVEFAYQY